MKSIRSLMNYCIKIITFINLPIKKKFLLFGLGTAFWFVLTGIVAVSVLTFIHYRYSQLSNTTIPYMQMIQKISPKLETLENMLQHNSDLSSKENFAKASINVQNMFETISQATIDLQAPQKSGNFFEMLTISLSKEDPEGKMKLQNMLSSIKKMQTTIALFNTATSVEKQSHIDELQRSIIATKKIIESFKERTQAMHQEYSDQMNEVIRYSINTIATIIIIAIVLLWFFTRWLTNAFSKPINSIVNQIHSIATGEIDISKKLLIKSQDEIGKLSNEFNDLIDGLYGINTFKKVIEEDSSLEIVYSRLGEVFEKEIGITNYRIYNVIETKKTMEVVYPPLFGDDTLSCNEEILNNCALCRAQKTGHRISSFQFKGVCREFVETQDNEHICMPLIIAGKPGAVIQFVFDAKASRENPEALSEKIFKAENYIKNSLSVIETKQLMQTLRESSLIDSLTGLYNRRYLQDHSSQLIAGVLRRKKQIGLLMCDMDYFKQVNDTFGHETGDALLKDTSLIFRSSVRDSDIIVRFGGEEFLILLVDTEPEYGIQVAEKIRKRVEEANFKSPKGVLKKTISIGVSEFPKDTEGFWHAIKYADVALYKAKESGRNQTVRFTSELWDEKDSF